MRKIRDIVGAHIRRAGDWLDRHTNAIEAAPRPDYRFAIGACIFGQRIDPFAKELIPMNDGRLMHPDALAYYAGQEAARAAITIPDRIPDDWTDIN